MDTFEAQRRLTDILAKLNATSKYVEAGLQFLLRHQDILEDLYKFTLDSLGGAQTPLRTRVNIAFFLDHACGPAGRRLPQLRPWVARDIAGILDRALPPALPALANVHSLEQLLANLARSGVLDPPALAAARAHLAARAAEVRATGSVAAPAPVTHDEIRRRMDEDRERTKRVKEALWTTDLLARDEFAALWASATGLTELDRENMHEDNEIALASRKWWAAGENPHRAGSEQA